MSDETKTCPTCGEEIKARALVCYHCGTEFDVVEHGYCEHCHVVAQARDGRCSICGGEVIDLNVESRPRQAASVSSGPAASGASVPPPPPPFTAPPATPMAPTQPVPTPEVSTRRRSPGRRAAWVFAVLLLLVGLGAWGLAHQADSSNRDTFAEDYAALGDRDGDAVTVALDSRVAATKSAYDAYVAAMDLVYAKHEAVTSKSNNVVFAHNTGDAAGETAAEVELSKAIDEYGAAIDQQRTAMTSYLDQLALLKAEVAR